MDISIYKHYLVRGEREKATAEKLMLSPYKRIVLLHVAILVGATPVMLLRSPLLLLLVLIGGKTYMDIWMHKKAHGVMMDEGAAADEGDAGKEAASDDNC
jgi:hypothetical protein